MALFIPGMTCPLCGQPITKEEPRRMFPPFVKSQSDPLYKFHDATVHERCFRQDPLASRLGDQHARPDDWPFVQSE